MHSQHSLKRLDEIQQQGKTPRWQEKGKNVWVNEIHIFIFTHDFHSRR